MAGPHDGDELDPQIADLMRQLEYAPPGSAMEQELTVTVTGVLLERFEQRLAAGEDRAALDDDVEKLAFLLESVISRSDLNSPWYAYLCWHASFLREDRWMILGQERDLDAAIEYLNGAISSSAAQQVISARAALARLHVSRADEREPSPGKAADLAAAVEHARSGMAYLEQEQEGQLDFADDRSWVEVVGRELRLALGIALFDSYRYEKYSADQETQDSGAGDSAATVRAWRDEAISVLRAACSDTSADLPARAIAADELGRALHDRYADPWPGAHADPADLDEAIDRLLTSVITDQDPEAIMRLIFALSDRLELHQQADDRDQLITWCELLLDQQALPIADSNFIRTLVSDALKDRAEASPQTRHADLDAAITHLETALSEAGSEDPERTSMLVNLADAYWQLMGGDASRYDQVDKMTAYAGQAWTALPAGDDARVLIGLYFAAGTHERLLRPDSAFDVTAASQAIEILTQIEPLLADEPSLHLIAMVKLGHFLAARGQVTGARADLSAAEPWLLRAANEMPVGDPSWSDMIQTLAVGLTVLANLGMDPDHLDQAIDWLTVAVAEPDSDHARAALTTGTLGLLALQRAGFTGNASDMNNGIAWLLRSYEMAPDGHPYRIAAGLNLASALLARFLRHGQAEDLDAARYYLNLAGALDGATGAAVRSLVADVDIVLIVNRGLVGLADGMRGILAGLDDTVVSLRSAVAMLPHDHPHSQRIRSDLGLALAYRSMVGMGEPGDLAAAARELEIAAAQPDRNIARPVMLLRAGGVLAAAAVMAADQMLLRQSIGYLTRAINDLDWRFGGRFRFAASIGIATLALYQLDHDPASLDSAVTWLREAVRGLGDHTSHPLYSVCMISLAKAYRAGGDAGAADAGFAALRSRARDLLLQSGTARSLHFARLAASEAMLVAGWCLQDGNPAVAVTALELGRGLILHAATSVNDMPELLTSAGHRELAGEWRNAASGIHEGPWDAGVASGATLATDLLAGSVGLEVPADLRVRALAALADSPAMHNLLAPSSAEDLSEALTQTGADAVVYLLAAADHTPGRAIVVPAAGQVSAATVGVIPLPSLSHDGGDVLRAYSRACEAVSAASASADLPAQERWRSALDSLCEWAWPAVMRPVLGLTAHWGLDRLPRLVLIPVGNLSLVPWHAARSRPDESGVVRYALQEAVISYAASGRQLRDVAQRRALPLMTSPVIVSDPTRTLAGAQLEARALADGCYPAGQYLGPAWPAWGRQADGAGTASQVLLQLPAAERAGASLLHLGCHGVSVGSAPGRSYLVLAGRQQLRVDAILRQASGRLPKVPGGLISLAACSSDMAPADYDEALTLATAFLAAGAVTVVGARWEIPDGATAVLMYMFHHFMTRDGQPPRDALRLAQLWMLDESHVLPGDMPEPLATNARQWQTAHPAAWAGIVHQGR